MLDNIAAEPSFFPSAVGTVCWGISQCGRVYIKFLSVVLYSSQIGFGGWLGRLVINTLSKIGLKINTLGSFLDHGNKGLRKLYVLA